MVGYGRIDDGVALEVEAQANLGPVWPLFALDRRRVARVQDVRKYRKVVAAGRIPVELEHFLPPIYSGALRAGHIPECVLEPLVYPIDDVVFEPIYMMSDEGKKIFHQSPAEGRKEKKEEGSMQGAKLTP